MFAGTGMKVINADKHLERFLKELKIPPAEVGAEYGLFRKARDLMQKETRHYALARLGLIVDSTGWEYTRIAEPVNKFRQLGYDVFMVFVDTSLETALARNRARAEAGGRKVPDSFVEDAWRGSQKNKKKFAALFGKKRFFIVDNDKDVEKKTWANVIAPKLRSLSNKILKAAIKNKKGIAWLKSSKTATKASRAAEWPKPPKPKPFVFKADEPKAPKGKVSKKGVPMGKTGGLTLKATHTGKGPANLGVLFPELFGRTYVRPKESMAGSFALMEKDLSKLKPKLDDLAHNIEAMYELEWKYYQIKNNAWTGRPERYENTLKLYEKALKLIVPATAKLLLPTFDKWLGQHALTSKKSWAEARVEADKDVYGDVKEAWGGLQSELDRYCKRDATWALVDVNLANAPRFKELIELLRSEDEEFWREDQFSQYGDDEDEWEEHPYPDNESYLESLAGSGDFGDQLAGYAIAEDWKWDILTELYAELVFEPWFEHWKAQGIVQTRAMVQKRRDDLNKLSRGVKNVPKAVVRLNLALNAAHQTGSMLDYVEQEHPDVNTSFLNDLTNRAIPPKWKKELKAIGVDLNPDNEKRTSNWQKFMRAWKTYSESLDEGVSLIYEGAKGPMWKTLEKNKVKLSDEERAEVMKQKAVWHHGPNGEATPAVWKAVVDGVKWYVTNTHRAFNVRPTLAGAISRYHKFIKSTA
jgi:hypothetical protein